MADFELYTRDSKTLEIPVYDNSATPQPVDLTGADITWTLCEYMGGPTVLTKTRIPSGSSAQIGIKAGQNHIMQVKILKNEVNVNGGIYCHHARVSFENAQDTVKVGIVDVKDSPAP
jgi:hypothetical protein